MSSNSSNSNFPHYFPSFSSSVSVANSNADDVINDEDQNQQTTVASVLPLPPSSSSASSGGPSTIRRTNRRYSPYPSHVPAGQSQQPVRSYHPASPIYQQQQQQRERAMATNSSRNLHKYFQKQTSSPPFVFHSSSLISSSSSDQCNFSLCSFGLPPQSIAARRLHTELRHLSKFPVAYCNAYPSNENALQWFAVVDGPTDTVYEGGTFFVELNFSSQYPFIPPEVLFLTRIYHCNISNQGKICLSTTSKNGWKPCNGVSTILQSIVSLLYACNPHSPLVPSIAEQYIHRPEEFQQIARIWTERYAI